VSESDIVITSCSLTYII